MAKLESHIEPPSNDEQIAALQARNAELELELQQLKEQLRQQTEVTPEKAVSLLQTTLEATADGILAINAQGWVTHFNRQFVELWQVPESILALQDDWQLLPFMQEQLKEEEAFLSQVRAEYAQLDLESHSFLEFKDGRVFERYSKPQVLGEDIIGRVISYRDITARKQVETELQQSEQLLQAIINAAPLRIYLKDLQGRYMMYNQNCKLLTNLPREEIIGKTDQEIFGLELANQFASVDRAALEAGQSITVETILQQADGIHTYITTKFPVFDEQGNPYGICGISTDISERKRMEEELRQSEERFRQLAENIDSVFWMWSLDEQKMLYISPAYQRIWGRSSQPLYESHQEWIDSLHPDDYEQAISLMERQIRGEIGEGAYRIIRPNGEVRWICDRSFPIYDTQGKLYRVAGIANDITAHKLAEEQLEASLQEKEALLKEVHHRVKNNLQVVCSLLDLQSQRIQEPQVLEVFQNSQNRVRSMALIHEKLYQSKSLSKVNLADYIQSLAMFLIQTYAVEPDQISLQLNLEPIILNLDTAIPCGLILNELISNALKHGFPGNTRGTVWITLGYLHPPISSNESDTLILIVGNNGVKLPELSNLFQTKSLGFQLVNVLTQQLNGQIEVSQSQGTEFKLRFRELQPSIGKN